MAFEIVDNSAPAPGFETCVFKASGFDVALDFGASGGVGLVAIMVAPQASHLVAPVLKFLPQFVQNVIDVVLCYAQKISSLDLVIYVIWQKRCAKADVV